jgi:hypothetical protein
VVQLNDRALEALERSIRDPAEKDIAKLEATVDVLKQQLGRALEHIEMVCSADWSAGDCDESDRAQSFVRHIRGLRPDLPKFMPLAVDNVER